MSSHPFDPDCRELWWLRETHPRDMLEFLESEIRGRKWRLFMCACARRCLGRLSAHVFQDAVAVAEAHADGRTTDDAMTSTAVNAWNEMRPYPSHRRQYQAASAVVEAVSLGGDYLFETTVRLINAARAAADKGVDESAAQAELLRDIFGNPFRPVAFDKAWRTGTVVSLAKHMYESHDFSAMPILADALQDAGCDNADVLNHCRNPEQPHVRGCWVVDLVLGNA